MKKDEFLEREFDAYFDGVTPPSDATDSAKKLIQDRKRKEKTLLGVIPVLATAAAACAVVAFVVNIKGKDNASPSDSFSLYSDAALTAAPLSAYSADLPTGLGVVKILELKNNSAVYDFCAYSNADGELSLVRADVRALVNGYRHDAVIYVEYTPEKTVYEPLRHFYDGSALDDGNLLVSQTERNGETVYNVLFRENGLRYYISVESADNYAYEYYLALIKKF